MIITTWMTCIIISFTPITNGTEIMNFDTALGIIFIIEGGYSNDKHDRGGETRFGISKRAHPDVDILTLTECGAKEIYRKKYWALVKADDMPDYIKLALFDSSVHQGVRRAIRILQRTVRVRADGIIGAKTLAAVHSYDKDKLLPHFLTERLLQYLLDKPAQLERYGRGWFRRLFYIERDAIKDLYAVI